MTRVLSIFASAALLGAFVSGCAGGGAQSSLPQPQSLPVTSPQSGETLLGTLSLDRSTAASIASRVTKSVAFYTPLAGGALPKMANLPGRVLNSLHRMDLTNYGGPTLRTVKQYNLYVNSSSGAPWGNPNTAQSNWTSSSFSHLLDQYTGSTTTGRYSYAGAYDVTYNTSGTLQDQDIYNIVYAVAKTTGTGYTNIYHVFLQNGVNQCSSSAGGCYGVSGGYCAYHGAVDFGDIGHTIYSTEPYQGIAGCNAPDNKLTDDTWSTLSHELYEAITDPDVQTNVAWYNNTYGEIGDECRNAYGNVTLNGVSYNMQKEYSNKYHACTYSQ